jgi:hypothetical protein
VAEITGQWQQDIENDWIRRVTWTGVTESDTFAPVKCPEYGEVTLQAAGTFGTGGTVQLHGTLDTAAASTNYWPLTDVHTGAALAVAALGGATAFNSGYWVKPVISAGTGVSVNVTVMFQAPRRRGN